VCNYEVGLPKNGDLARFLAILDGTHDKPWDGVGVAELQTDPISDMSCGWGPFKRTKLVDCSTNRHEHMNTIL